MDRAVEVTHTADGITLLFDTFQARARISLSHLRMPVLPFMQQSLRMTDFCRMT